MANHINNRTIIITSSVVASQPILGAGSSSWANDQAINAIRFYGIDTTAKFELVYASNTAQSFFISTPVDNNLVGAAELLNFSTPQLVSELRVKTLTAGTAWIYLS